jgi:ankyrin repeat protein
MSTEPTTFEEFWPYYGEPYMTMCLLVSSDPPARAGLQVPLIELLVELGASVRPIADATGGHPLRAALVFNQPDAAAALVGLGAPIDELSLAAGLGRLEQARALLPAASSEDRHRALALAAQQGEADIIRLLLDAGEDPSRYNPKDVHSHATPLHHAALNGHETVVYLLVERGASMDLRDRIYDSTPEGWANHGGHVDLAAWLNARAAG